MDSIDKKYYKINQVADMLGVPASTLRFWEKNFNIIKPRRTQHGIRYYSPEDIDKIRMVQYLLKERGMRIDKAQEIIKHNHSGITRRYLAIERLKQIREQLSQLLQAIDSGHR